MELPRLYAIVDSGRFAGRPDPAAAMAEFTRELLAGGVTLVQYRNKGGDARAMLADSREMKRVCGSRARVIVNDRADLCLAAGCDGVHVGQDDLAAEGARRIVGNGRWVGVSTHSPEQVREADGWPVDYIAVGPVFGTSSKRNPDPVIGLEGVRLARKLTGKPLVAIGGITRGNAGAVVEAGADAVAVISDLVENGGRSAEEFLRILAKLG